MSQTMEMQQDYRTTLQAAARAFLDRHQAEHLGNDGALFDRTVAYLITSLDAPAFMAPSLVHLAMSEQPPAQPLARWIGIDMASGPDALVLIDRRTGMRATIPRRILPERFLAHTAR